MNQLSSNSKKLSKSVQYLNDTENELKYSYLSSSVLSVPNDLFTNEELLMKYSLDIKNFDDNNKMITEKYLAHHNMSK